ncbi:RanBP-type and C3HC4-type zinc finger-containing protein 1 [Orchesella cincta]|uniref:RanBP-type and C3HC4-type zinc finger-containing protein 1 n=1 Tax=Orchesella cincta TaxID=48709 RepID=A0A1D2ML04_ORCCI|nr:RanBP-type and C3HC4-type zinc finger-containing protein 1 [Orchesella cincta]
MDCCNCQVNVNEVGGTQMKGCRHFLCAECIVDAVKKGTDIGIKCQFRGSPKCSGVIELDELVFMVPDDVYEDYICRLSNENIWEQDDEDNSLMGAASLEYQRSRCENIITEDLNLTQEDKESGWFHVSSMIEELVQFDVMTYADAVAYVDSLPLIENRKPIACPICLETDIPAGEGIILKDCFHLYCKECLARHIESIDAAEVKCPFIDGDYACDEVLKPREIKELVSKHEYERHFDSLALKEAEESLSDVFHCLTPDCKGFCIADPTARLFRCPLCKASNCVVCKVIHSGTCAQYWQEIELAEQRRLQKIKDETNRAEQRRNDQLSAEEIQRRLSTKIWMRCPGCNVVIEKNGGCPHMKCHKCKTDFNWSGVPA